LLTAPSFFARRQVVFLIASLCCLLWGSAYPAIKNGYALGKKTLRLVQRTLGQVCRCWG